MQKWEYLVVRADLLNCYVIAKDRLPHDRHLQNYLDEVGREGYELVSACRDSNDKNGTLIFKRPLEEK